MIPYNPSSFNTNKTILEQILELKKWLKEHPSYAVYTTYIHYKPAENVDYFFTEINGDPDFVDNIAVGDLLWFGDGYISPIASITIDPNDRENSYVTISQPVTSLIGPTGPQGPRGYDGVSVTNASVNASGYLIITLSNGLTVNTGYVVGPQGTTGPEGPEGPQGPTGPSGVSITNVAIDGNQHLIVTLSDGSSIDAGSVSSGGPYIITISGTSSGYITNTADRNKITSNDIDVYIYNSTLDVYFRKETNVTGGGVVRFSYTQDDGTGLKNGYLYITTNNWQWILTRNTNYYKTTASLVNSQTATSGQVLMADGSGGASWQNVSSGKYLINVTLQYGTSNYKRMRIYFQIVHTSSSFTDINEIVTALNDQGYIDNSHYITAVGSIETGISTGVFNFVCGLASLSGSLYAKITHNDQLPTNELITAPLSSINIYQNSIQL